MADRFRDTRGGYGVVNKPVMIRADISAQAKGLYALLCTYAGGQSVAWPGQTRLAEEMATSDRTVRRWVEELQSAGVLYVRHIPVQGARIRCEYCLTDNATTADNDVHGGHGCPAAADTDVLRAADMGVPVRLSLITSNEDKKIPPQQQAESIGIVPIQVTLAEAKQKRQAEAKDVLWQAWQAAYSQAYGVPYKATAADWKQIHARGILGMDAGRLVRLVSAWFGVPEKERPFFPPKLASFATGWERAETLAKSTKSSKDDFNKFSGWDNQ